MLLLGSDCFMAMRLGLPSVARVGLQNSRAGLPLQEYPQRGWVLAVEGTGSSRTWA